MNQKETLKALEELQENVAFQLFLTEVGNRQRDKTEECVEFKTMINKGPLAVAYAQGVVAGYGDVLDCLEELIADARGEVESEERQRALRRGDFD